MTECIECGSVENLDEHHTSYEPEKTVILCRACHQSVHGADSHRLKPSDDSKDTTIMINRSVKRQIESLKVHNNESFNDALERILDGADVTESTVDEVAIREIVRDEVKNIVANRAIKQ